MICSTLFLSSFLNKTFVIVIFWCIRLTDYIRAFFATLSMNSSNLRDKISPRFGALLNMYPWHFYTVFWNYYFLQFSPLHHPGRLLRIRILLFTSNFVVSLNIKFLHFQISSATNINFDLHLRFNFKLNSNFKFKLQLHTSPLSFNFNFSSTSHVNVKLNLRTTISICTFTPQLQILTSNPA